MSECLKKHSKILFVLYHLMKFILLCWGQSTFCGLMEPELLYFLRMELKFAISNLRLISRSEKSQKEPFSRKGPVLALGPKEKTRIDREIERSLGLCFEVTGVAI